MSSPVIPAGEGLAGAPASLARQRHWWLTWSRCPGLGWSGLRRLEQAAGSLEAAWMMPLPQLQERLRPLPGFGPQRLARLAAFRRCPGEMGPRLEDGPVLVPGDPAFPAALRQLERPPLALFWRGRGSLWPLLRRRQAIAVVGTRRPSPHGLAMARALGQALARAGWPVVSGLAEGIDGAVHEACLAHGGAPVAVLGTPLERVYPRHHSDLQRRVAAEGLLLSELAPGSPVQPGHFAARNRLQVALARAVVVVECPRRSGALHSATLAWQQGLPLWAVPADTGRASAAGSNALLQAQAAVLLDPADLVAELGPGPLACQGALGEGLGGPAAVSSPGLGPDPELMAAVGPGASFEQLVQALGCSPGELSARLLTLELAGRLCAEAGLCWRPA